MAKPDMAFPSMDTTLPSVMMVKSLVQSVFFLFMAIDLFRICRIQSKWHYSTAPQPAQ